MSRKVRLTLLGVAIILALFSIVLLASTLTPKSDTVIERTRLAATVFTAP